MGVLDALKKIGSAIKTAVIYPFYLLAEGLEVLTDAGKRLRSYFPFKRKPPSEKIRAALRKQWLELEPGEKGIPGVEWEGEIYFETPK